jgi:protein-S-isoprenylcysteine O-methyltransferase Ste14
MGKAAIFAYGLLSYAAFVIATLWGIAFLGNFGLALTADAAPRAPWRLAVAIDTVLLLLFAVQHSIMARPWFKARWTAIVPAAAERSTYVLLAGLLLMLLFSLWQPIAGTLWNVAGAGRVAILVIYGAGWFVAILSTFLISHTDFSGLRQVWANFTSMPAQEGAFRTPSLYKLVRHPMMLGLIVAFWATPLMTAGHLLFAAASTAYILVGTLFEERDLRVEFGSTYEAYQSQTPMLIPFVGRSRK